MEPMLTYQQVSQWLGIKLGTLYSLVARERIPHVRLGNRLVRFRQEELRQWVESSLVIPAQGPESSD